MAFTHTEEILMSGQGAEDSVPTTLRITVSANDSGDILRIRGPNGGGWNLNATIGVHDIALARLGFRGTDTLSKADAAALIWISEGLTGPRSQVSVDISTTLPDQVVIPTNVTIADWDPSNGFVFDEATPVTSPDTVTHYVVKIDGDELFRTEILVGDLPYSMPFNPDDYAGWLPVDTTWTVTFKVAAAIGALEGPFSTGTVKNVGSLITDTWYLDASDWTVASETTEGEAGLLNFAISGGSGFVLSAPYDELRVYGGPMPAGVDTSTLMPADWVTLANTFPITIGGTAQVQSGVAIGDDAATTILAYSSTTGRFLILSVNKPTEILALDPGTRPVVTQAPTVTAGLIDHDGVMCAEVGRQLTATAAATDATISNNLRFRVAGVGVGTAGPSPINYTPVSGDDRKQLDIRYAPENAAGTTVVFSANIPIVRATPVVVGSLADQEYEINDGAKTGNAAAAFSGDDLTYGIQSSVGATINSATADWSIPEQTSITNAVITVTAGNSGGTVQTTFDVAWVAPDDEFTMVITPGQWSVRMATEADTGVPEFSIIQTIGNVTIPEGYGLRGSVGAGALGPATVAATKGGNPNTTLVFDPTWLESKGLFFNEGDIAATCLYARKFGTPDEFRASDRKDVVIAGFPDDPDPPDNFPGFTSASISNASSRANETFGTGDTTTKAGGFCGSRIAVLGYEAFRGNTAVDANFKSAVLAPLASGKEPYCKGGFSMQHEAGNWFVGVAFAKLTPRIWNSFTDAQRAKIDALIKAEVVTAAWSTADVRYPNPPSAWVGKITGMDGTGNMYVRGNMNYHMAPPYMVCIFAAYMGSAAAARTFIETATFTQVRNALVAASCTNPLAGPYKVPRPSGAPGETEINQARQNWRFHSMDASNVSGMLREMMESCYSEQCFNAHPQSNQIGDRGATINGPTSLMNTLLGQVGMPDEMKATDGGDLNNPKPTPNIRSSMTYAWDGLKMTWPWILLMIASGLVPRNSPALTAVRNRISVGRRWMEEVSYTAGWKNFAKDGVGGGNGNWLDNLTLNGGTVQQVYALDFNFNGMDIVSDMLGA